MNSEVSISDLTNKIKEFTNSKSEILIEKNRVRPKNSEVEILKCDNSKLINNSNWQPNFDIDKGLNETID